MVQLTPQRTKSPKVGTLGLNRQLGEMLQANSMRPTHPRDYLPAFKQVDSTVPNPSVLQIMQGVFKNTDFSLPSPRDGD